MRTGNIQILDLDFEYKLWKNKLNYFSKELELLLDRIHVIKREYPSFYIEDEKFMFVQNQQSHLNIIKKKINTQEHEMALYAEDYPINEKHIHYINHEKIRAEIEKLVKREAELLNNVYQLLCYPLSQIEASEL